MKKEHLKKAAALSMAVMMAAGMQKTAHKGCMSYKAVPVS